MRAPSSGTQAPLPGQAERALTVAATVAAPWLPCSTSSTTSRRLDGAERTGLAAARPWTKRRPQTRCTAPGMVCGRASPILRAQRSHAVAELGLGRLDGSDDLLDELRLQAGAGGGEADERFGHRPAAPRPDRGRAAARGRPAPQRLGRCVRAPSARRCPRSGMLRYGGRG